MQVWWWVVAASDHQRLRSQAENSVPSIPVVNAGESDSSVQLVGSAPQQAGRSSAVEEMAEARLATCTGPVHPCGWPPKSQCTIVGRGGSPPSSPNRGAPDSNGYSMVSETTSQRHRCRGHRGSRKKKWLVPARLDMPIFKLTDPGAEVMYTLCSSMWMPSLSNMMRQACALTFLPVFMGTLVNGPAHWMKARISLCRTC